MTVTILGIGFSSSNPTPSAYVAGQLCATTSWTTATQLMCAVKAPVLATKGK